MELKTLENYIISAEKAFADEEYMEGMRFLENVLTIEPNYSKAHNHLGWLYIYHIKDWEKAEKHLKYAIKCKPKYDAPYIHLSHIFFERGRFDEFSELLEQALKLNSLDKGFIYNELGRMYEAKGKFRMAIKYFKESIKCTFNHEELKITINNIKRCRRKRRILWF